MTKLKLELFSCIDGKIMLLIGGSGSIKTIQLSHYVNFTKVQQIIRHLPTTRNEKKSRILCFLPVLPSIIGYIKPAMLLIHLYVHFMRPVYNYRFICFLAGSMNQNFIQYLERLCIGGQEHPCERMPMPFNWELGFGRKISWELGCVPEINWELGSDNSLGAGICSEN